MTVLVTGGAGFIGSHLAERLLKDGNKVLVIDNLSTGSLENIESAYDRNQYRRH
jgi:nucleoside-diphosphate-sugar epimerase